VIIFDVLVGSVGSRVLKANRGRVADVITMRALVDTTLGVRRGRQDGERNAAVQALHF
jgi:5-carboxymethyl-2-hydroxymuconate isomerase